jgi:hypothetical protein
MEIISIYGYCRMATPFMGKKCSLEINVLSEEVPTQDDQ